MSSYLHDGAHALLFGVTGAGDGAGWGGKSSTANWWHHQAHTMGWFDWSIFFNAKPTPGIKGTTVKSVEGMHKSHMENGTTFFNLRPQSLSGEEEHAQLWDYLSNLPGRKIVFHDEAQDYEESDSLHRFVKRGSVADIKSVVMAQRAWDLHEPVRNQLVYTIFVGPVTDSYRAYFDRTLAGTAYEADGRQVSPFEHVREYHEPFQWSVFGPGNELVEWNNPVPAEYA